VLYHYAITPEVFEPSAIPENSREAMILVELLRGIADNGLLANLHAGSWHKEVQDQHRQDPASPELRDKLRSCLKLIHDRKRLIRHPAGSMRSEEDAFRWLHWALECHRSDPGYPFKGIFATGDYIELAEISDPAMVPLQSALDHECWLDRPKSVRFVKTEVELKAHLKPLLRYAEKVTLIDPYLTCRKDRFFNTVQHCADLLGRHDGRQQRGRIHIHAGNPLNDSEDSHHETPQARLDRWDQYLQPVIKQWAHKFEVSLWKNKPGGKTFHDRYIITDQCGVNVSGGLDFGDDPTRANLTNWSWLEREAIQDILQREFHSVKSPYRLLESRRVG
jgi:hypothetical protein